MIRADDLQCRGMTLLQDSEGYCFTSDAVLLADFVTCGRGARLVDFGTGSGILALLVAEKRPSVRVTGVEIQESLYRLAVRNAERNALWGRVRVVCGDLRTYWREQERAADAVMCNPPYYRKGACFVGENPERARARHETDLSLRELCEAAKKTVKPGGDFFLCYPAERLGELFYELKSQRLEPKVLRAVQTGTEQAPYLYLVRATREGAPGLRHLPPLIRGSAEEREIYSRTEKEER